MNFQYNLLVTFSIIDGSFIIDLLQHKGIKNAVLIHCSERENVLALTRKLNDCEIRIASLKISDRNFTVPRSYHKTGFVIHTSCENWDSMLESGDNSFQDINSWVVITEDLTNTSRILSRFPLEPDSDITVASKRSNSFDLYEVYNTGTRFQGTFVVVNVGNWDSSLNITKTDRRNLQGIVVNVAVVQVKENRVVNQTMEQYMEKALVKIDTVHRIKYFTLLKYLRDMYNMTYELQRVSSWGYLNNGSFDGMVGALSHGTAEFGGSPIFFREDRTMHIQYVAETWPSRHSFLFRHPKHPGGLYTIYTRPLATIVWYCAMSLVILAAILLWLTLWAMRRSSDESSPSLALLTIWGAFCQQGAFLDHGATSVKLVLFIAFVFAVTTYQYYNATIVSSLLLEPPKTIRTLKDLVDSDLKAGVDDVIYNRDYFMHTTDPIPQRLYKKKILNGSHSNFYSSYDGMALVKAGGFAFHIDTTFAFAVIKQTFDEREICELSSVQLWPVKNMAIALRRRSPYREYVTYGIRKMYEAGLPARVQAVFDIAMPDCVHTPDSSVFCVNIREFSMPLIALAAGMGTAFVVLLCEILVAKTVRKRNSIEFRN